jgi:hypothetical protein
MPALESDDGALVGVEVDQFGVSDTLKTIQEKYVVSAGVAVQEQFSKYIGKYQSYNIKTLEARIGQTKLLMQLVDLKISGDSKTKKAFKDDLLEHYHIKQKMFTAMKTLLKKFDDNEDLLVCVFTWVNPILLFCFFQTWCKKNLTSVTDDALQTISRFSPHHLKKLITDVDIPVSNYLYFDH